MNALRLVSSLALVTLLACPPNDPDGTTGGGGGLASGGGGGGGDSISDTRFPQCAGTQEQATRAALRAAVLRPLTTDGTFELPVSSTGCSRLVQVVKDGKLARLSLRIAQGFLLPMLPPDGNYAATTFGEAEVVVFDEVFRADGMHGDYSDSAGDVFTKPQLRQTLDVQWTAQGALVSQTYRELRGGEVEFEVEQVPAGPNRLRAITRWRRNGALEVQRDVTGDAKMAGPVCPGLKSNTPDSLPRECTPAEKEQVQLALSDGLEKGSKCLSDLESSSTDQINAIDTLVKRAQLQSVKCYAGGETAGYISGNDRNPASGASTINVNVGMFSGCDSTFQQSTLFHEALHIIRGPHDAVDEQIFELPSGSIGPLTAALTDPLRSCEEFCFGDPTKRTACMCARCLGTKACDGRCSGQGSCVVRVNGAAVSSEAVGSMCYDPSEAAAPSWFPTHMACVSGCSGGNTCKSYSVSCNPTCK